MAKCIGCKIDNSLTEYKKRRNVTSLMSMRNAVKQFTNGFSKIPEGLRSENTGSDLKNSSNIIKNNRHITSVYPGICATHLGHFGKLLETVSDCFKDDNQTVIARRSYADKTGLPINE